MTKVLDYQMKLLIAQAHDRCRITKEVRIKTPKKFLFIEEYKEGEFRLCYSSAFEEEVNNYV